ncbi:MAG: type IV toxin-antitoxin system AbiEi family antitoxin domain-containing protein [Firmicutes bacterium]|nr:type IV toxin-antitoxin system AbiEi family antitoxin domain-containing protein [Bacillota bacterium]
MKDYSRLKDLARNGIIWTRDLSPAKIGRDYLKYAVDDGIIESVARGIYILKNELEDKLYIFQLKNSKLIYSANTSAFLLGLTTRDSDTLFASAPLGYNNPRLSGIHNVIREKAEIYGLGATEIQTAFGNIVKIHNAERTICDLFSPKYNGDKFVQVEALKSYLQLPNKNIVKLFDFAKQTGAYDELKKRIEVLL